MAKEKGLVVKEVEKELNPMIKDANALTIKGEKEMTMATELLSNINKKKDAIEDEMERVTAPAKEIIEVEKSRWSPFLAPAKEAIKILRTKISDWQTEQQQIADDKKAKEASRIGEGKGKLKMETAMKRIDEIDKPEKNIVATSGSIKFRPKKVFELVDIKLIPTEYLLIDETKIRKAMEAGIELPGLKYSINQVPVNSR